jgi:hypothetical protein
MGRHLAAISAKVAPGRHAALLVDQAAWHMSPRLAMPANITIVPLPAKCPELNRQENVWQFLRQLAVQPRVPILRRHRRSLLRRLEQAHRPAMAHHVHRAARLKAQVLIREAWYNTGGIRP